MSEEPPRTRWEQAAPSTRRYAAKFAALIAAGEDIDGEARLADALVRRHARILDAGAGMGRVAAGLVRRGHEVLAVEKDPELVAQLRATYPDLPHVHDDLLAITPELLAALGLPTSYDLIVVVGNVMILLAPDTEQRVLQGLAQLLAADGRLLIGFRTTAGPANSRDYPYAEFAADAAAAGLLAQHRFGSYELAPAGEDYVVAVLAKI